MNSGVLAFIILCVFVLIIIIIGNLIRNAVLSARDKEKKKQDLQMGLYQESQQENLSDRFK